ADGRQLLIPSHHGLAVFENGRWSKAAGPAHDYMGFSATRDALYSSGHPAPGSGLTNPFGLIKSRDGGRNWQQLGFTGESDFHTLATSYETNAVYVLNHQANTRMSQAGIYYTLTDGMKWTRAAAKGLGGEPNSLAVHPTDAGVVAAGTDDGLYLSRNSAESFERLAGGKRVLAQSFDLDGLHLWFSTYAGKAALARIALKADSTAEEVPIPALAEDAVAYIAQNPARRAEIAIATFKRSVFLSKDQGRTWTQIAKEGSTHE
ncbi:MAG TPA: glycosyl hydrolase, partial [Polaromonas sp.]